MDNKCDVDKSAPDKRFIGTANQHKIAENLS
jgi:hypothetical protein